MAPSKANSTYRFHFTFMQVLEILPLSVVWNVKARSPKYLELNIESRYMNRLLCYKYSISVYIVQLKKSCYQPFSCLISLTTSALPLSSLS